MIAILENLDKEEIVASGGKIRVYNSNLLITTNKEVIYTENFRGYLIDNQNRVIPKRGVI